MLPRIRAQLPVWRRALRRRRRTFAALAAALVLTLIVPPLLPPDSQAATVVVADVELPAGTVLDAHHLRSVRVAVDLVPPGAVSSAEGLVGQETAVRVPADSPVLTGALDGGELSAVADGSALMAVPVPAALAPLLIPGSQVEIIGSTPESAVPRRILAHVVEVPSDRDPETSSMLSSGTAAPAQVLIAIDRDDAAVLARSSAEGWLSVALIG